MHRKLRHAMVARESYHRFGRYTCTDCGHEYWRKKWQRAMVCGFCKRAYKSMNNRLYCRAYLIRMKKVA